MAHKTLADFHFEALAPGRNDEGWTPASLAALFADPDYEPPWPWLAGCSRWADPYSLVHRALDVFFAAPSDHWGQVIRIVEKFGPGGPTSFAASVTRSAFISLMEDPDEDRGPRIADNPEQVRLLGRERAQRMDADYDRRRAGMKAGHLLAAFGVALRALVRVGPTVSEFAPQALDEVIAAVNAGLSLEEIRRGLRDGWPDRKALAALAALRSHPAG